MENYGLISLLPSAFVLIVAFWKKRTFEPILLAGFLGFIILYGFDFLGKWVDALYTVLSNTTNIWTVLVCGLFGSLIALLEKSGGVQKFSAFASKYAKTEKKSLFMSWFIGLFLFVDDYLHSLALTTTMKNVTDKQSIPRKVLAYIVNSGAASLCIIVPFSTWAIFMAGLFSQNGAGGMDGYIKSIPFMFYGWIGAIVVPLLFITGIIPKFKQMKIPDIQLNSGANNEEIKEDEKKKKKQRAINFIIPMVVLIAVTIIKNDMLWGVMLAIASAAILYIATRTMKVTEVVDAFYEGFKNLMPILILLMVAFTLQEANKGLGMADFIIKSVQPYMVKTLMPFVVFVVLGLVAFFADTFWGLAIVAAPIVFPLAQACGANIYLVAGALVSATAFGSHACPISDTVLMTAGSLNTNNIINSRAQLPYAIISFAVSALLFLACGFIF